MADRKKSPIWSFFSVAEDSKFVKYNICKPVISRGGKTTKTFTTSNLVSHFEYKQIRVQWISGAKSKSTQESMIATLSHSRAKQLTLAESCDKICLWDINDRRAHNSHGWIGKMIAIDCQPLSIIDDQRFQSLVKALEPRYSMPSRCYITDNILARKTRLSAYHLVSLSVQI